MNKGTDKSWAELVEKENAVSNKVICDNTDEFGKDTESENEDVLQITENDVSDLIDDRTDAQRMEETAILPMSMENSEESVQHVANRNKTKMNSEDDPIMRKRLREDNLESLNEEMPRNRCNSTSSSSTSSGNGKKKVEFETDPGILARRQKDIDYGKNTIGYDKYIQAIPKKERTKEHPRTPPKYAKYSRRGWDGMVKLWRKQLHCWDPSEESSNIGEDKNLSPS